MRLFRHISSIPADACGAVVAIGNFDGLHRGHQVVIAAARARADAEGRALALLTFRPHPRRFFRPDEEPFRLTPFRAKVRAIGALGVDILFVLRFDAKMASVTAEAFVEKILHQGIGVSHVVVGHDFAFGNQRRGNAEFLRVLAEIVRQENIGIGAVRFVDWPDSDRLKLVSYLQKTAAGGAG